ncbi:cytochrome c oxidase assembly protein [Nocardia africana]|uniref:cytochrome c oxidase assembly protein n=1 Tax=Nocardia africana TaxID=134964 RepID=UPI0007A4E655|nr:cytochrome c oxidase assembly protein [Nocardia africana]MCC3312161.1 cytochrome c oxidase assembly protein [Nocardia africana]
MDTPLTVQSVIEEWRWDTSTIVVTAALGLGYGLTRRRADRRGRSASAGRSWAFGAVGLGVWLLTGISVIGVYSGTLFWMRALQILLLLYVVPFGLATGRPLTAVRDSLGSSGQARMNRVLASAPARVATYPLVSSIAILATPWLLILTPWYDAVLRHGVVDALTRLLLVAVGFLYFYSRLQTDPVPHRYSQALSLLITVFESLADGVLGLVLWLGPLVAVDYYTEVGRTWGPDLRMDQIIGAGIIWVLGDVLGLPYLLTLMRSWAADERRNAARMDAELDAAEEVSTPPTDAGARTVPAATTATAEAPVQSGLWWENDPVLRDRFRR